MATPSHEQQQHVTSSTKNRTAHQTTTNDVFSRLDNKRGDVFSRLDNKHSLIKSVDQCGDDDSKEVTSSLSLDTQQQQQITTVISKRRIKLTDIKDNNNAMTSSLPSAPAHVISVHHPPTTKVVGDNC